MPWRWGPPNRGIRASVSYASPPYSGASYVCCFLSIRRPPTLANLVVPFFLSPRPTNRVGGAISFCLLIITIYPPRACLSRLGFADRFGRLRRRDICARRSHLPVRMPCGFLEVSYGTACPVLACPSRRASSVLPLHGTPLVMSSFQSPRSSSRPTVPIAPRLISRHARRGGVLAWSCGAIHVRTP